MTKHHEGGMAYSREIYERSTEELTDTERRLKELEEKKEQVINTHSALREIDKEERPGMDYALQEELDADLEAIDSEKAEIEPLILMLTSRLNELHGIAKAEAESQDKREGEKETIDRQWNELHEIVLPKVHEQVEEIQNKWEQLEHRGNELFQRARAIEQELRDISKNDFDIAKSKYIIDRILELFEIKERIAIMYQAAFSPNLKKKEF